MFALENAADFPGPTPMTNVYHQTQIKSKVEALGGAQGEPHFPNQSAVKESATTLAAWLSLRSPEKNLGVEPMPGYASLANDTLAGDKLSAAEQ